MAGGNVRSRRDPATGRFLSTGALAPAAVVVVLTRQQRRYAERQAAKLGRTLPEVAAAAWDEATGGAGASEVALKGGQGD
jgi:hypothetical protein